MIQRVQSVYLLLVAIISLLSNAFAVAIFSSSDQIVEMYNCHISGSDTIKESVSLMPLAALTVLVSVLSIVIILRFKNRKSQINLNKINIILNVLWIGLTVYYFLIIQSTFGLEGAPTTFAITPVINIILLILASRSIKKDEALVKSVDRIR